MSFSKNNTIYKLWTYKAPNLFSLKFLQISFLIFFLVFSFISCTKKENFEEKSEEFLAVQGLQIVSAPLVSKIYGTGIVQGIDEVPLVSKTEGTIKQVNFNEGDRVKKDFVMLRVDDRIFRQVLSRAKVNKQNAQRALSSSRELFKQGAISRVELQNAQAAFHGANAEYLAAQMQVDDANFVSPIDGFVAYKNKALSKGSVVAKGMVLARVSNRNSLRLVMSVADRFLPWISVGDKAEIKISALNLGVYEARIQSISASVDGATGGVSVELVWVADKQTQEKFRTGLVAQVSIDTKQQARDITNLPIVPMSTISVENKKNVIYTASLADQTQLEQKKVTGQLYTIKKRIIQTGREFVGNTEIVEGLTDDEALPLLVISSIESLQEGQLVTVDVVGNTDTF